MDRNFGMIKTKNGTLLTTSEIQIAKLQHAKWELETGRKGQITLEQYVRDHWKDNNIQTKQNSSPSNIAHHLKTISTNSRDSMLHVPLNTEKDLSIGSGLYPKLSTSNIASSQKGTISTITNKNWIARFSEMVPNFISVDANGFISTKSDENLTFKTLMQDYAVLILFYLGASEGSIEDGVNEDLKGLISKQFNDNINNWTKHFADTTDADAGVSRQLSDLLIDHTAIVSQMIETHNTQPKEYEMYTKQLEENTSSIASFFARICPKSLGTESQALDLWESHLTLLEEYINVYMDSSDSHKIQQHVQSYMDNAENIGDIIDQAVDDEYSKSTESSLADEADFNTGFDSPKIANTTIPLQGHTVKVITSNYKSTPQKRDGKVIANITLPQQEYLPRIITSNYKSTFQNEHEEDIPLPFLNQTYQLTQKSSPIMMHSHSENLPDGPITENISIGGLSNYSRLGVIHRSFITKGVSLLSEYVKDPSNLQGTLSNAFSFKSMMNQLKDVLDQLDEKKELEAIALKQPNYLNEQKFKKMDNDQLLAFVAGIGGLITVGEMHGYQDNIRYAIGEKYASLQQLGLENIELGPAFLSSLIGNLEDICYEVARLSDLNSVSQDMDTRFLGVMADIVSRIKNDNAKTRYALVLISMACFFVRETAKAFKSEDLKHAISSVASKFVLDLNTTRQTDFPKQKKSFTQTFKLDSVLASQLVSRAKELVKKTVKDEDIQRTTELNSRENLNRVIKKFKANTALTSKKDEKYIKETIAFIQLNFTMIYYLHFSSLIGSRDSNAWYQNSRSLINALGMELIQLRLIQDDKKTFTK